MAAQEHKRVPGFTRFDMRGFGSERLPGIVFPDVHGEPDASIPPLYTPANNPRHIA